MARNPGKDSSRTKNPTILNRFKKMEPKKPKTSEFHVDLGDIQLSPAATQRIEAKIQEAVLSELAGYRPNPEDDDKPKPWWPKGSPLVVFRPKEWMGIWVRIPDKIFENPTFKDQLGKVNQRFNP